MSSEVRKILVPPSVVGSKTPVIINPSKGLVSYEERGAAAYDDLPPSFDLPYKVYRNMPLEAPRRISAIQYRATFDQCSFSEKGEIRVKQPLQNHVSLPRDFKQFAESAQNALDFEYKNSPFLLHKSFSLVARKFAGYLDHPAGVLHFDPVDNFYGLMCNVYITSNRASTESNTNPRLHETSAVADYETNLFSARCLHGQPMIPKGKARVMSAVVATVNTQDLFEAGVQHPDISHSRVARMPTKFTDLLPRGG